MNRVKFYEAVSDYLDDKMDKKAKNEFEILLSKNKKFKKQYEIIRNLVVNLKSFESVKLPKQFDINLEEAINKLDKNNLQSLNVNFPNNPIHTMTASVAAAVVLVIVTTFFFKSKDNKPNSINFESDEFVYNEEESDENIFEIDMTKGTKDILD